MMKPTARLRVVAGSASQREDVDDVDDSLNVDARALKRVAEGDPRALGEVYDRHAASVLRFCIRIAGREDAEDVLQISFVRAARLASTFDSDRSRGSAKPWLFGIASKVVQERRRSFVRYLRALARFTTAAAHNSRTTAAATDSTAERADLDLERALSSLSAPKRITIMLAEVEGYTCEEIATILSVPLGTVFTRLHHARKELRAYLDEGERG